MNAPRTSHGAGSPGRPISAFPGDVAAWAIPVAVTVVWKAPGRSSNWSCVIDGLPIG